jgi:ferrous iron transport protein B
MAVLADLQNQECGVISKVMGYGAFRKRINEMGFVVGTKVTAIKKAPLQDPVEYEIMSYRVSLRESEARRIEIVSKDHADEIEDIPYNGTITEELLQQTVQTKTKHISIALVGNPNCGKTTLFNYATGKHERVGNYGGVTVDVKTAKIKKFGYTFHITDLPGTYSLSEYSPEELFVRSHLAQAMPDVVINVIDTSNIKRNLYLTTQLIDMNIKVVGALNMYDELENKGDDFDYTKLGTLLGIPFVPTTASKGKGLDELLQKVVSVHAEQEPTLRHIHINYGYDIMDAIRTIRVEIDKHQRVSDIYHKQYIALKLLEKDSAFTEEIVKIPETKSIIECAQKERKKIEKKYNDSAETIITDAKYSFIRGALKETYTLSKHKQNKALNKGLDALLTHKWFGFPVFLFFMWAMFQLTFSLGSYPMDWIDSGVTTLGQVIGNNLQDGMLRELLVVSVVLSYFCRIFSFCFFASLLWKIPDIWLVLRLLWIE